jgi:putative acyl-CoA dehydrogenase
VARLVGEEGRGVRAIIRMVNHTRLDCLLGAATAIRRGTVEAIHQARQPSSVRRSARRVARDA